VWSDDQRQQFRNAGESFRMFFSAYVTGRITMLYILSWWNDGFLWHLLYYWRNGLRWGTQICLLAQGAWNLRCASGLYVKPRKSVVRGTASEPARSRDCCGRFWSLVEVNRTVRTAVIRPKTSSAFSQFSRRWAWTLTFHGQNFMGKLTDRCRTFWYLLEVNRTILGTHRFTAWRAVKKYPAVAIVTEGNNARAPAVRTVT